MTAERFYADHYGRDAPCTQQRMLRVLEIARGFSANRLLDVGCGDGQFTLALREAVGATEVFGVEIAPAAAELAEARGILCTVLNVDVSPLPYEQDSFDLVYCGEVIEHVFDTDGLLDELYRVLRPGGHGFLTSPNLAAWHECLSLLLGYQPIHTEFSPRYPNVGKLFVDGERCEGGGHLRVATYRAFRQLLMRHRFEIRSLAGTGGRIGPPSRILPWYVRLIYPVASVLNRIPSFAPQLIALVMKPW